MAVESNEAVPARRVLLDVAANLDEVKKAVESLTDGQLLKLEKYARYRIRGLGRKAAGREGDDLLREAITLTLSGTRRWRKDTVDLFTHLLGVMRSVSSHWAEQATDGETWLESELVTPDRPNSPFSYARAADPDPERVLSAKEELRKIEDRFAEDPVVPKILAGMREGMTGTEIQAANHLTKKAYESAIKRLRRGIAAMERE